MLLLQAWVDESTAYCQIQQEAKLYHHWFTNALASCMLPAAGNLI